MKYVRRGSSIIEIVIAATLISIAVIAALSLTNQSQKQNTYARDLAEATKYASQAADWIRNERNNLGWATLNTVDDGIYCIDIFPVDFLTMEAGACDDASFIENTQFQREILVTKTTDTINVVITVSWVEQVERQAKIEMELTSWH
jgi:Tfp pilus assembly protein PilV